MGERLGKYELFSRIASGGMAEIHVARSSTLGVDKVVVIKRLLPQHLAKPEFVEMFLDEARIAAALNHPNVVQMYDFGPVDDAYFMAMEYLHGADLRAVHRHALANGDLIPIEHVITVLTGVCSGLHHAHEAKGIDGVPLDVVHRDVTPHNVVVTFDGAVKLVDFGIAKAKNRRSETRHGTIKGKVPYMSPEQLRGESIDRRGDVYSLGVILYELTTGQRPYVASGTGEFALMMAIVRGQIRPPTQVRSDYPPLLEAIVLKAMARRPADRFQSAREVELALEAFASSAGLSSSASAVSSYMTTVFRERLERWKRAKAEGKAFAEHVAEIELERAQTYVDDESERELVDTTDMSFQVEWDDDDPQPPRSASALGSLVSAGVDIVARQVDGVEVVALAGRLTESFTGAALGAAMRGVVLVDLAGVERVTSFGVREWLEMMHAVRSGVKELYLARLSESVATQMGMIRSFAGPGTVVSFYAPYLCDACGSTFRWLVDCERDAEAVRSRRLPAGTCPTCGSKGHLDDDDAYGAFAVPHAGVVVPPAVRAAHDALGDGDLAPAGDVVEKLVVGNVTRLRVRGPLDRLVRWSRVLEGLEGAVVIDFQSPRADGDAGAALAHALSTLGPEVTSLELRACPLAIVEAIVAGPRADILEIATVALEGTCASCHASRVAVVELSVLETGSREGTPAAAACRRCDGPLAFEADLQRRIASSLGKTPASPPEPGMASRPPRGGRRAMRFYIAAGGVGLAVLVVLVGSLVLPVRVPTRADGVAVAAAATNAGDEALPAWTGQSLVRETGFVVLVGTSGPVDDEREGLELARADAVRRLAVAVLAGLPAGSVKEYVTARAATDSSRRVSHAELKRTADRFLRIAGTTSTPERIDVAFTRTGGPLQVYARYSLGEEGLRSAVATYARTVKLNGVTLANELPLVVGPTAGEAEVVVVGVDHGARARVLAVGDHVLRVDDRPVANLQAFAALTARTKSYALLVESSGTSRNVQLAR